MPYNPAEDSVGLSNPNSYIVITIPPTQQALVFRVKMKANDGYKVFDYGQLGSLTTDSTNLYTTIGGTPAGAASAPPANGTIAGTNYTQNFQFALNNAYDNTDMWYYPEDYRDRLFEVITLVTPAYLRVAVNIPTNVTQQGFQKNRVAGGIGQDFGYKRGRFQVVHLPRLHYGYQFGNDINLIPFVRLKFLYGEYIVEIPKNAQTIFQILNKDPRFPARWTSLPVVSYDPLIKDSLIRSYGFEGFPIFPIDQQAAAIQSYSTLLQEALV